jgi:hypothetical protein
MQGIIALDSNMDLLQPSNDRSGTADVLIVEAVRDIRDRIVLRSDGKVLAIDGHSRGVDLYEMRLLGHAERAEDLTGAIRTLLERRTFRARVRASVRALLATMTGRHS